MRRNFSTYLLAGALALAASSSALAVEAKAEASSPPRALKEWTLLVFLNGHNNLDSFGAMDINEMEKVGSTDQVNVVVQWASTANGRTRRLLARKDNDPRRVTSPTVQDLAAVDMGDWRNLVEFVRWGAANYPAKRYFVDVWDHGSGWHKLRGDSGMTPKDISWDDHTGNYITTEQLGEALKQSAEIIGHRIDIYGSDACLMAMAEVAGEMVDSVDVFVGSEEVEPGEGWPYDGLVKGMADKPTATAAEVAKILTAEYVKSYQGGSQGTREVTFSAFDLSKTEKLYEAIAGFGQRLRALGTGDRTKAVTAANDTISFTYSDYGDLQDFLALLERAGVGGIGREDYGAVRGACGDYVIANQTTSTYSRAKGLAIWLPGAKYTYNRYAARYAGLKFNRATDWGAALQHVLQDTQ